MSIWQWQFIEQNRSPFFYTLRLNVHYGGRTKSDEATPWFGQESFDLGAVELGWGQIARHCWFNIIVFAHNYNFFFLVKRGLNNSSFTVSCKN